MNTVKSFWIGWGSLIAAGGGAYYFAKRQINADRREKHLKRQQLQQQYNMLYPENGSGGHTPAGSSIDPAPTGHAPQTEQQGIDEKSKYEASAVYKRPKGDRFS